MSYHIYHTKGIVLDSWDDNDVSKTLKIYTRDLGMVYVKAQGLRKLESKLRYGLQFLSLCDISLVRGKCYWRIIDSNPTDSFGDLLSDEDKKHFIVKFIFLLKQLLEEGENQKVFSYILEVLKVFKGNLSLNEQKTVEAITIYRVLYILGHIDLKKEYEVFIKGELDKNLFNKTKLISKNMIKDINYALAQM